MNTLVIVLISAVCLLCGYMVYGRWLAKTWGIDPKAKTPAYTHEDGQDYVPTDGWVVFAHQFSSIAGAGPVTGAIQAAVFGWVPVFLWIILGGIFFGAVTDFGALYASVKNEGKSMGLLIEQYIGKTGKKLFLLFCWLFTLIVTAAFADMVAGTFNAYETVDGVTSLSAAATVNGAAGSISLLFIAFAVVFGLIQKKAQFHGWKQTLLGLVCTVAAFVIGMNCPLITTKANWSYMVFAYIFLAAVLPMWLLMEPRDLMTTFMFAGMIIGAVVGLLVAHPAMNLAPYTGFHNEKSGDLFPILFVTVASRGGEIGQYAVHFLIRFPKPDHQAALADAPGFLDAAQELKALLIVGLRPDAAVMRGRGFHIVVDDVGLGVHDGSQGLAAAAKIGDEHFDGGTGFAAVPDSPDGCREVGRSAVRQVVPRHGRHHGMAQAEGRRCLAHAGGLFGVGREDDAAADAGAQHQHHSPGKLHAVAAGQVGKAGIIRIIAIQLAIPVNHGVHCADGRRTWFHLIAIWDDQLFVRDGNIDGFERLCLHKGMGFFLRWQRMQLIGIAAHGLMDDFGIAVAQFGSDQTVFHVALPFCLLRLYYFCPSVP